MSGKVVLITGASTGLGYEMVRSLCRAPEHYQIILSARSLSNAQKATEAIEQEFPDAKDSVFPIQTDVESDDSIRAAFDTVKAKFDHIDVLINNAGAQFEPQYYSGTLTMRQAWNKSWDVNVSGSQIMTHVFVPLLLKSSNPRLLFITSGTSTLEGHGNSVLPINHSPAQGWPKEPSGVPMYRSSKTGLNMMMREWHRILKNDGVKTWAVSPGYLATGLGGSVEKNRAAGAGDPQLGGEFVREILEGKRDEDVGKAILRDKVQPW